MNWELLRLQKILEENTMWVDGTEDKRQSEGMSKRFGVGGGGGDKSTVDI